MQEKILFSRRDFVAMAAAGVLGLPARNVGPGNAREIPVYVGTYTDNGKSEGIYLFRMDPDSGVLQPVGAVASSPNPSFLALHPGRRLLYAVNELTEFEGEATGSVSAFVVDPATGGLRLLNRQASRGGAPCYVTVDRTGRFVLVANYVGGNAAVFPIREDGSLGEASSVVQHRGAGADPDRQDAPHAHCIVLDPTNRFALVADLGIDRVMVYRFDARAGVLSPADAAAAELRAGSGPRHLVCAPDGRTVYVLNELDSTLTVLRFDPATGSLAPLQALPTLTGRTAEGNYPADIHLLPTGRFIYASNRGHDSIAVFAVDRATGELDPVQQVSTGGTWPRNFALDPAAKFLFVANQRSDSIIGFRIDPATGRLTPTGQRLEVPSPVCIRFDAADSTS